MLRLAFALTAATLALAPAHAADIKNVDCVQKTVDAATVKSLLVDVDKNFANIDNQTYSEGTAAGMRAAAQTCRAKYGWTDKASQASVLYALFALSEKAIRRHAVTAKLNYSALERRFMSLTPAERADAMQEATLNKLATGALGAKEMDASNAKVAGAVFGFLAVREKARKDFAEG